MLFRSFFDLFSIFFFDVLSFYIMSFLYFCFSMFCRSMFCHRPGQTEAIQFFMVFLGRLLTFFSKVKVSKNSLRNTIRVSNILNPDQARCSGSKLLAKTSSRSDEKIRQAARVIICKHWLK